MIYGAIIGGIELLIFFIISYKVRKCNFQLQSINSVSYYWFMLTILTMIWEIAFISNYDNVSKYSNTLIQNKEHVWTNKYSILYILPWRLSEIFYAEYGAYADREYMLLHNDWSRIIEGTHAIFCGFFALFAMIFKVNNRNMLYLITGSISMGSQLMNSLLYMFNYFNQLNDCDNVNYNNYLFPAGKYLFKRPFMYVNIFWTFMPLYTIIYLIAKYLNKNNNQYNFTKNYNMKSKSDSSIKLKN